MTRNTQPDKLLGHPAHSILHVVAELESLALDMAYEERNHVANTCRKRDEPPS